MSPDALWSGLDPETREAIEHDFGAIDFEELLRKLQGKPNDSRLPVALRQYRSPSGASCALLARLTSTGVEVSLEPEPPELAKVQGFEREADFRSGWGSLECYLSFSFEEKHFMEVARRLVPIPPEVVSEHVQEEEGFTRTLRHGSVVAEQHTYRWRDGGGWVSHASAFIRGLPGEASLGFSASYHDFNRVQIHAPRAMLRPLLEALASAIDVYAPKLNDEGLALPAWRETAATLKIGSLMLAARPRMRGPVLLDPATGHGVEVWAGVQPLGPLPPGAQFVRWCFGRLDPLPHRAPLDLENLTPALCGCELPAAPEEEVFEKYLGQRLRRRYRAGRWVLQRSRWVSEDKTKLMLRVQEEDGGRCAVFAFLQANETGWCEAEFYFVGSAADVQGPIDRVCALAKSLGYNQKR